LSDLVEARVSYRYSTLSAEDVFDAWLDPVTVRRWMAYALSAMGLPADIRQISIDPRVTGTYLFSDMRDGTEMKHWGTYRKLMRGRLIEFSWFTNAEDERHGTSIVAIDLQPESEGCTVELSHSMDHKYSEYLTQTEHGWRTMLRAIDTTG